MLRSITRFAVVLNAPILAVMSDLARAQFAIKSAGHLSMLIRLFQLTARSRVAGSSSVLSQDSSPVSASVRQRRGLPGVPGRLPLVRGLQVPPMRAPSRLRAGGTKTLAVRRLSSPSLPDIGDHPSQYEDPADPLVLGGLSDDDRQARGLGVAFPAPAWSSALTAWM